MKKITWMVRRGSRAVSHGRDAARQMFRKTGFLLAPGVRASGTWKLVLRMRGCAMWSNGTLSIVAKS